MNKAKAMEIAGTGEKREGTKEQSRVASVKLDTSRLSSSYCNVVTVNGTREEVVLTFGLNEDWDRRGSEIDVRLLHRVVFSPLAAKRLHDRLSTVLGEHERRLGGSE